MMHEKYDLLDNVDAFNSTRQIHMCSTSAITLVDNLSPLFGYKLYKQGKYAQAIPVLQAILKRQPLDHYARLLLGAAQMKNAEFAAAQKSFRFVLQNSQNADSLEKAGQAIEALNLAGSLRRKGRNLKKSNLLNLEKLPYLRLDSVIN